MKKLSIFLLFFLLCSSVGYSQNEGYTFTMKKDLACTSVKNQNQSSTCWCFSGISFFESELMRMGKKEYDLSEMFIVRHIYENKADRYVRMHGSCTFSGGGEYHDLLNATREYGLVPDNIYPGLNYGEVKHNHNEMDGALKGYIDAVVKNAKLTTAWFNGFNGILDAYLGEMPGDFSYEGKTYNAINYRNELGINPDDYVIFSSFSHQPFYKQFILDVPDNWAGGLCYNLPLEDFTAVIDNALMNGYTVAWASDMSDKGFSMRQGVAVIPEKSWNEMSEEEVKDAFNGPHPQKVITQELRQKEYDNYSTTDDHGMHIVGLAVDQEGNTFYKVKNSWGVMGKYDGFIYVSKQFVQLKTTNCMVHKDALPKDVAKKMGIK